MQIKKIRAIAAKMLNVGKGRVWINPEETAKVKEAITKQDVKALIEEGIIRKEKHNFHSRARALRLAKKKKMGRRGGRGKRRGTRSVRMGGKRYWIKNVRALRQKLRELRKKHGEAIEGFGYSRLYSMIKGNYFRGKRYLEAFVLDLEKKGRK